MMEKKYNTKELIKKMYNESAKIQTIEGKSIEIPEKGSLGLLALGYKGIIAWKKKKDNK